MMELRRILRLRGAPERVVLPTDREVLTRGCIVSHNKKRDISEYYTNVHIMGQRRPHMLMFIKWHLRSGKIRPSFKLKSTDLPLVLAAIGPAAVKNLEPKVAHSRRGFQVAFRALDTAETHFLAEAVFHLIRAEILEYEKNPNHA